MNHLQNLQNALNDATTEVRETASASVGYGYLKLAIERYLDVAEESTTPDEKRRREYYQDIIYDVCRKLDRMRGRVPGRGIVCGTADEPSTAVQDEMDSLATIVLRGKEAIDLLCRQKALSDRGPMMTAEDYNAAATGLKTDLTEFIARLKT